MQRSVIVSACRTPIGSFQGALATFSAPDLGAMVIREAVKRARLKGDEIDQVIMGNVLAAGLGQAPARQAALTAGLPNTVSALTINKVCSSGLKSIMLADQLIRLGDAQVCVAGGMESMTNAPYLLPKGREGFRLGDGVVIDSMIYDGLRDAFDGKHMGVHAEACAAKYSFTREEQDAFAIESYMRAGRAIMEKAFAEEIVTVEIPQRKGEPIRFEQDEEPGRVKADKVQTLQPAFHKDGTITAANASSLSDGAAAVVIMSEARAKQLGLTPLATIIAHAEASHEPEWYTTAPIKAITATLQKAKLTPNDIDFFEINEAFSAVTLAAIKELKLEYAHVNINGGAVALGHPIGASGARLVTTLAHLLKHKDATRGLVSLCNGGGEATALILERNL